MHDNFVIYVDFDSTLYNTKSFMNDLTTLFVDKTDLSADQIKADYTSHFFHAYLGGYEYDKHAMSYGLNPAEMWKALDTLINSSDYLFADSAAFMQSLFSDGFTPKILTFGEERFQLAKINSTLARLASKELSHEIEVTVVNRSKHEHIRKLHAGQRGVLIDDKPNQTLPENFTEIYLNRSAALGTPKIDDNIALVSSLSQARQIIDRIAIR